MLPLPVDRVHTELEQIIEVLVELKSRIEQGVPGEDMPANDMDEQIYQLHLRMQVHLMSQRLLALSEVLE